MKGNVPRQEKTGKGAKAYTRDIYETRIRRTDHAERQPAPPRELRQRLGSALDTDENQ